MTIRIANIKYIIPILCVLICQACPANADDKDMIVRHQMIINATTRIEVAGHAKGTGFVIDTDIVVTNYHVVQKIEQNTQGGITANIAQNITVRLCDGSVLPAIPLKDSEKSQLEKYIGKDYVLLKVKNINIKPLQIGTLGDAQPGTSIYIAGYPFGVDQPIVTKGMLSTKWEDSGYLGIGGARNVAWLDVSMNAGNSGGPVIIFGASPEKDRVIGIATFNLNPFAQRAEELGEFARQTKAHGSVSVMGIDIAGFAELVGNALRENSLGVGGCVAIEYAQEGLK